MGKYKPSISIPSSPDRLSKDGNSLYSSDEDTSSSLSSSGKRIRDRTSHPCAILNCKRTGTRLFTSLRGYFETKENHSNRCCEGCYRRDLRRFKKTHPDPFKKNQPESFKNKSSESHKKSVNDAKSDESQTVELYSLKMSQNDTLKQSHAYSADYATDSYTNHSNHSNSSNNSTLSNYSSNSNGFLGGMPKKSPITPKSSNEQFSKNGLFVEPFDKNFESCDAYSKKAIQRSPMQVLPTATPHSSHIHQDSPMSKNTRFSLPGTIIPPTLPPLETPQVKSRHTASYPSNMQTRSIIEDPFSKFCHTILRYEGIIDE